MWKTYFIHVVEKIFYTKIEKVFTMMNWKDDELWEAVSRRDVTGVRGALRKVPHLPCLARRKVLSSVYA